jgi:acyl-[acyl-carrier-protein]-phospholipid O-acyltransferase / long-chain-fatty-acid--[acyl-carrier-protein] ligase
MHRDEVRPELILPRKLLRMCRRRLWKKKVADSSGTELTGGRLLAQVLAMRRLLKREVVAKDESHVPVLLPPSVPAVLVNAALSLLGRIPVNLNYTTSSDTLNLCLSQVAARHVLTSRRFLTQVSLSVDAQLVCLEDLVGKVTWQDKAIAAVQAYLVPVALLECWFGLLTIDPNDVMTVAFTAGSTGDPKGVMLSYRNIGSNVVAVEKLLRIKDTDVVLGILPFFHAFGFMGTLWTVLALDPKGVYHFTPLDARRVGQLCQRHKVTILLAAPTFLRTYLRRCDKAQFRTLEVVIVSAEKLPLELAHAFRDKFGVEPVEAYGSTELSPAAATNVPKDRLLDPAREGAKEGTVGRVVPCSRAKVVDPDSGQDMGVDREGLLLVAGPNVMLGYLNQPAKTAAVMRGEWYVTGDIARIDREGFITITDRASRFSKIGGEIVPHLKVEESLQKIASAGSLVNQDHPALAVTAVPDSQKGERLIVVHEPLALTAEQLVERLSSEGIPNLWIPSRDSFLEVPNLPMLGAGKLDLKALKRLALARFGLGNADSARGR